MLIRGLGLSHHEIQAAFCLKHSRLSWMPENREGGGTFWGLGTMSIAGAGWGLGQEIGQGVGPLFICSSAETHLGYQFIP